MNCLSMFSEPSIAVNWHLVFSKSIIEISPSPHPMSKIFVLLVIEVCSKRLFKNILLDAEKSACAYETAWSYLSINSNSEIRLTKVHFQEFGLAYLQILSLLYCHWL